MNFEHISEKEMTENDKIAIAYARACGFKWLAVDKNGDCAAYVTKPRKPTETACGVPSWEEIDCWVTSENPFYQYLLIKISFLSWEDEEPFYIGDKE